MMSSIFKKKKIESGDLSVLFVRISLRLDSIKTLFGRYLLFAIKSKGNRKLEPNRRKFPVTACPFPYNSLLKKSQVVLIDCSK